MEEFFHWIGETLGAAIRFIVDGLAGLLGNLYGLIDSFLAGLTNALGISTSVLSLLILVLGLAMLWAALRALLKRRLIGAVIWAALGVVVLTWLIH